MQLLFFIGLALSAHADVHTTVVLGSADINGTQTLLSSLSLDAAVPAPAPVQLCTLTHRPGLLPMGVMVDDAQLAVVIDDALVVVDLHKCSQRLLIEGVIGTQTPVLVDVGGQPRLVAVRELDASNKGSTFDVVAVPVSGGPAEVLASRTALWVSPAQGAHALNELRFLVGEADGRFHLDQLQQGDFVVDVDLGPGVFRSAVVVGPELLVEVFDRGTGRSQLRDRLNKAQVRGLPGLSPVTSSSSASLAPASLAVSTGLKDGSVLVDGHLRHSGRAGVARPQALGDDVVVAWLDRGASLAGELWAIGPQKSTLLLPARARTAVRVYGFRREP